MAQLLHIIVSCGSRADDFAEVVNDFVKLHRVIGIQYATGPAKTGGIEFVAFITYEEY